MNLVPSTVLPAQLVASTGDEDRFLESFVHGRELDSDSLLEVVYAELHGLAERYLGRERPDHTLQPTALVHEAYLRLAGPETEDAERWNDPKHFFATAARAMRRVLVDHARGRGRSKRGGEWKRVQLDLEVAPHDESELDVVALDRALEDLRAESPRQAQLVELRFFAGLSVADAAELLDVSERTAALDWRFARAWLARALREES